MLPPSSSHAPPRRLAPPLPRPPACARLRQVSVLFDGDGQWYRGEVLGYDKRKGRHLVLYDDGEDEWLALERENLAWHKLARGASAACPGVQKGGLGWAARRLWPGHAGAGGGWGVGRVGWAARRWP